MMLWPRMQISPRSPSGSSRPARVLDRELDAPHRVADRARLARLPEHVEARDRRGLGEAVALEDLDAELLLERAHHLDGHRRAAREAEAHAREVDAAPAWWSSAKYMVGTPAKSVTRSRAIDRRRLVGREARQQREAPARPRSSRSGCRSARTSGRAGASRARRRPRRSRTSRGTTTLQFTSRFAWLSSAPFGFPVVPDV